jgi:hypothetical protein
MPTEEIGSYSMPTEEIGSYSMPTEEIGSYLHTRSYLLLSNKRDMNILLLISMCNNE